VAGVAEAALEASATEEAVVNPAAPCQGLPSEVVAGPEASGPGQLELGAAAAVAAVQIAPKAKKELSSDRVQNPHDPEATYAVKGQGAQKKEHVGCKVQVDVVLSMGLMTPYHSPGLQRAFYSLCVFPLSA
jgi:hypothetical protein